MYEPKYSIKNCPQCHEEKEAYLEKDAMGICLGYTCDDCRDKFLSKFSPHIFKGDYSRRAEEYGERIEPYDDY